MTHQSVQIDPLNSPHPIPWNWVLATLTDATSKTGSSLHSYRSQSLISPDQQYFAYSRVQLQVEPTYVYSRVRSVLFLENLETGNLKSITPGSPLADNPFISGAETDAQGSISLVIPIAWSERSDRLLARSFESLFGSDLASDYAVIWDRLLNRTSTVAPRHIQYSHAILLGWSQRYPDQALFRAGTLGEEDWRLWTVDINGQTTAADGDQPAVFGQISNSVWMGPQVHR